MPVKELDLEVLKLVNLDCHQYWNYNVELDATSCNHRANLSEQKVVGYKEPDAQ